MKKIYAILFSIFIGTVAFAYDNSAFVLPASGANSYTKTTYTVASKFGEYFRTPKAKFLHTFNALGQEIENVELTIDGKLVEKVIYEYDSKGNLLTQKCVNAENEILWRIENIYKNNLKIEENTYNQKNQLTNKSIYKYSGNKCIDESYYNDDGSLSWKTTFSYDDKANISEIYSYFSSGELESKTTFKYKDKNLIQEISYFSGTSTDFTEKEVYRYDDKNLLTEITTYSSDNQITKRKFYKYDAKANVSKITTYSVAKKFGTTVNELSDMEDFSYNY